MSISIRLPSKLGNLADIKDVDKFNFRINGIANREIGFFDESLTGFIIYKDKEQPTIRKSTVYLEVSILPANLVDDDVALGNYLNTVQDEQEYETTSSSSNNFNIHETTLTESDIMIESVSESDMNYYVIWRFEIPVSYPKRKFADPKLLVSCILHDNSGKEVESKLTHVIPEPAELILPDYIPGHNRNLLSELNGPNQISELSSLIETRNSGSSNPSPELPQEIQIKTVNVSENVLKSSISIPVSVSLVIKLKSTKAAGRNNMLLATLNIESSEELNRLLENDQMKDSYHFKILSLTMDFKFGVIKELNTESYEYPLIFKSNDSINLTYKLLNNEYLDKELKNIENNSQYSKPIGITLVLQVQKLIPRLNEYVDVSNIITTKWTPYLDFGIIAPPINNSLKTSTNYSHSQTQPGLVAPSKVPNTRKSAMMNSLYKASPNGIVPTSAVSVNLNNPIALKKVQKPLGTSSSSVTVNLTTSSNSTLSGLKLTFQGKINLKLGEILSWKVQAINNSMNRLNLSLIVQNPLNFNPTYNSNASQNNNSSSNMLNTDAEINDVVIYNKLQLYSSYNSLKLNTNGIIILNNDIRIGPLDSNTVFETEIKLIGLSKGIFNLDGIKIFDINSGDGLDFGKLVEVFVI